MLDRGWMAEECKASHSSPTLRQFDEEEVSLTADEPTLMKARQRLAVIYVAQIMFMDNYAHGTQRNCRHQRVCSNWGRGCLHVLAPSAARRASLVILTRGTAPTAP